MKNLTKKQRDTISDNLRAFIHNFEEPIIVREDYGHGLYVYRNKNDYNNGSSWVQFCYNVDYLNGWLYGAVQAKCKQLKQREDE